MCEFVEAGVGWAESGSFVLDIAALVSIGFLFETWEVLAN